MLVIALLVFAVNVAAVAWAITMIAVSIINAMNPLVWIVLAIVLLVTVAMLGQFIARQGEHPHHA